MQTPVFPSLLTGLNDFPPRIEEHTVHGVAPKTFLQTVCFDSFHLINADVSAIGVQVIPIADIQIGFNQETDVSISPQECITLLRHVFPSVRFSGSEEKKIE